MGEETHEPAPPASESERPWEAAQYEAALAYLERLQEQLDDLRSTIPSLVAPIARPAASKAQFFSEMKTAAVRATDGVQSFRAGWTAEETRDLFARSKESLEKDGDLSRAGEVARYGWTE